MTNGCYSEVICENNTRTGLINLGFSKPNFTFDLLAAGQFRLLNTMCKLFLAYRTLLLLVFTRVPQDTASDCCWSTLLIYQYSHECHKALQVTVVDLRCWSTSIHMSATRHCKWLLLIYVVNLPVFTWVPQDTASDRCWSTLLIYQYSNQCHMTLQVIIIDVVLL